MSDEWGPWIEHDGKHVPVAVGQYVICRERGGREDEGLVNEPVFTAPNWWWPKSKGSRLVIYETDIVAYRIRKPRGLTILENLLADLPAPSEREVV